MVSVLAFSSNDPSLNPPEVNIFFGKKNKKMMLGFAHIKIIKIYILQLCQIE